MVKTVALALLAPLLVAAQPPDVWRLPVEPPDGSVVNGFDPPEHRWSAGHRGVDLAAPEGTSIHAAAAGVVTYAGRLAGRGVVVVTHGRLRSTYEPVAPVVAVGDRVRAGEALGELASGGSHCSPGSCLHWGVKEGERYLDPVALLASVGGQVRLLPLGQRALTGDPPPPLPTPPATAQSRLTSTAPGSFQLPVATPYVTSRFGMRRHPITGVVKLHDGTDFHAPCGTPVRAAASGVVSNSGSAGAYGLRVVVDHGLRDGQTVSTSYSHLSQLGVSAGQYVTAGHVIGLAGTTGLSTGCHLHFMVLSGGAPVNPMPWLSR